MTAEDINSNYYSEDLYYMPSITYNKPMSDAIDKILARSPFSSVSEYLEYHVKKDTTFLKGNPNDNKIKEWFK